MSEALEPYKGRNWNGLFLSGESSTGTLKRLLICAYQDKVSLWICNASKKGGWEIIVSRSDAAKALQSCHLSGTAPGSESWGEDGVDREIDVESEGDRLLLHIHDASAKREKILVDKDHLRTAMEQLGIIQ